jgi:hypothetical protein
LTISSITRKAGPFIGNGVALAFPFNFKVFSTNEVLVVRALTATGVETPLAPGSEYSVILNTNQNASPGGTVTLAGVLSVGTTLAITSQVPNLQPTDLTNAGGFYPTVINDGLDRATIQIQQLAEKQSRAISLPVSSPSSTSTQLPAPIPSNVLGWNASADSLINYPLAATVAIPFATQTFNGNGSTTVFTLTGDAGIQDNIDLSVGGVTQVPGINFTYNALNRQITFLTGAPPTGSANVAARYGQAVVAPAAVVLGGVAIADFSIDQYTPNAQVLFPNTYPTGWNTGAGRMTVDFQLTINNFFAANPNSHFVAVTRFTSALIATAIRGQGLAIGNAT